MPKQLIVPKGAEAAVTNLNMSPAIAAGPLVFLTGVTGSAPDGAMPDDPETQFRAAFAKIGAVLGEAGLGFAAIVEMTSYHVGLRDHFELFDHVRLDILPAPYPAWTAIEAAGLRRPGALVEIRIIASRDA
ncbi:RidA family protein [Halovulum sp. GXIMD14793]